MATAMTNYPAERQPKPIPHPRRLGECAEAIVDVLAEYGITGAQFFKSRHARVEFTYRGVAMVYRFPTTPKSSSEAAKRHRAKLVKLIERATS